MSFPLHPRLAAGTIPLGRLSNCRILLKSNALFPWLIIVPEVDSAIEDLHQLPPERFLEVIAVLRETSIFVSDCFAPEKLNVACIGNQVRQMHLHVVGRKAGDPAWPGTVWAHEGKEPYADEELARIRRAAEAWLAEAGGSFP